jgi:pyruvate dehydrogenase E1 component beta subunit
VPLDLETIVGSVRRTGRLVVAHEAVERGGAGAEIAATVSATVPNVLRAPVARVGAPFAPVPASAELEALYVPSAGRIVDAVRSVVGSATARLS